MTEWMCRYDIMSFYYYRDSRAFSFTSNVVGVLKPCRLIQSRWYRILVALSSSAVRRNRYSVVCVYMYMCAALDLALHVDEIARFLLDLRNSIARRHSLSLLFTAEVGCSYHVSMFASLKSGHP